jgi:CheY-like chemotaxis protein
VSELPLILVIEDEYFLQADIEKVLTDGGFATNIVSSGEEALTLVMGGTRRPSALVTDVKLAGRLTGWEVAKRIREKNPLSQSSMLPPTIGIGLHTGFRTASSSQSRSRQRNW